MDWTQITLAFIVGLPALLAAIGTFINTIKANKTDAKVDKLQAHATRDQPKVEAIQQLATDIKKINNEQSVKISAIGKAVNGDLESRFKLIEGKVDHIEGKIDKLFDAMIAAKLLADKLEDATRRQG